MSQSPIARFVGVFECRGVGATEKTQLGSQWATWKSLRCRLPELQLMLVASPRNHNVPL